MGGRDTVVVVTSMERKMRQSPFTEEYNHCGHHWGDRESLMGVVTPWRDPKDGDRHARSRRGQIVHRKRGPHLGRSGSAQLGTNEGIRSRTSLVWSKKRRESTEGSLRSSSKPVSANQWRVRIALVGERKEKILLRYHEKLKKIKIILKRLNFIH